MSNRTSATAAVLTLAAVTIVVLVTPGVGGHAGGSAPPTTATTQADIPAPHPLSPQAGSVTQSMLPAATRSDPAEPIIEKVIHTSTDFLNDFLTYGYPDDVPTRYLQRSRPYMSRRMYERWAARVGRAEGGRDPEWLRMRSLHKRQIIEIVDLGIGSLTGTDAIVQVVYEAGTVTARADGRVVSRFVGRISEAAYHRRVALRLTLVGGEWKVADYAPADMG
jgi:hypothetical protein